jgi:hypothetical protein
MTEKPDDVDQRPDTQLRQASSKSLIIVSVLFVALMGLIISAPKIRQALMG